MMGKLVCETLVNGEMLTKTFTTAASTDVAAFVARYPGVGKPFYFFNTLPGVVLAADYDGAPLVTGDKVQDKAAIDAMLANPPTGQLTFA